MTNTTITIFGGSGFIGEQITRVCARAGFTIKMAEKHPKRAEQFKFNASRVGQIVGVPCDYTQKGIEQAIEGSHIVINCIGILAEGGHRSFMQTHCYLPEYMAKACAKNDVQHFIHISALGIEDNKSDYAKSKLAGEQQIRKNFDKVTYLRPSVVFGPKDSFFNMFASMAQFLPALPLIGGGKTKFQPVYVGDVADAALNAIKQKAFGIYHLGGPEVVTFKEIYLKLKKHTGQSFMLIPLPFFMAKIQAFFMGVLPNPPLTTDQVTSLKYDNIVSGKAQKLSDLGVTPTYMDAILPSYLERYKKNS
jgi:NADH dehydrogenase